MFLRPKALVYTMRCSSQALKRTKGLAGLWLLAGSICAFAQTADVSPANPAPSVTPVPFSDEVNPSPTATPQESAANTETNNGGKPGINTAVTRITPWLGLNITAIRGVSSSPLEAPLRELPLQVGDRLQKLTLRQAVRRMYDSQRFSDIQVDADRSETGVALTFHLVPNFFIGTIHVFGAAHPPNEIQLINATKLQPGYIF